VATVLLRSVPPVETAPAKSTKPLAALPRSAPVLVPPVSQLPPLPLVPQMYPLTVSLTVSSALVNWLLGGIVAT
jgi:hypothetical protein